jgi:hypothetical protein
VDVPGAFLHVHIDDMVNVIMDSAEQMNILIQTNPKYSKFILKDTCTGKDQLFL